MHPVTFTELRKNLKKIMDNVADRHEPVIIKRPKGDSMVLLSLESYESMKETAYLLGSEANAKHLRESKDSLEKGGARLKKLLDL